MITKIDHIGIAVKSLAEAIPLYEKAFGLKCSHTEEVASQQVKVAFFQVGDTLVELLEATAAESPVAKFIDKHGPGVHHIAYGTNDVVQQLAQAKQAGCQLLHEQPFDGAHGKSVAFIHPKSTMGVLTEFCQRKAKLP